MRVEESTQVFMRLNSFGAADPVKVDSPSAVAEQAQAVVAKTEAKQPAVSERASWMHMVSFAFLLKFLCICSSVLMQMSPMRDVVKFRSNQSTGGYESLPLVMLATCGSQWCFYGLFAWAVTGNRGFLVVVYANALGVVLGVFYTITFQSFCDNAIKQQGLHTYLSFGASIFVFQAFTMILYAPETALLVSGAVAAALSVAVSASPLVGLEELKRTRNADAMPADLIIACFLSCVLWMLCGVMIRDLWIFVPNAFGLLFNCIQLAALYKYAWSVPVHNGDPVAAEKARLHAKALACEDELTQQEIMIVSSGGTGDV
jgi:solute carrier family 50 protein (sugar transporter)